MATKSSAEMRMSEPLVMYDSPLITESWGEDQVKSKMDFLKHESDTNNQSTLISGKHMAAGPVTYARMYWFCTFAGLRLSGSNVKMKILSYIINIFQAALIIFDIVLILINIGTERNKESLQVQVTIFLDLLMMILSIIFIQRFSKSSAMCIKGGGRDSHGGGGSGGSFSVGGITASVPVKKGKGKNYRSGRDDRYSRVGGEKIDFSKGNQSYLEHWIDHGSPGWRNWMMYVSILPVIGYLIKDTATDFIFDTHDYAALEVLFVVLSLTPVSTGLLVCFVCIAAPYASSFENIVSDYGVKKPVATSASETDIGVVASRNNYVDDIEGGASNKGGGISAVDKELNLCSQNTIFGIDDLQIFKDKLKQLNAELKHDTKVPNTTFIIPMIALRLTHSLFEMWIIIDISTGNYEDDFQHSAPTKVSLAYRGASFFFDLSFIVAFLLAPLYTNYLVDQIGCAFLDEHCCSDKIGPNLVSFIMWLKESQVGWSILSFRPSSRVLKVAISSSIIILGTLLTRILNN